MIKLEKIYAVTWLDNKLGIHLSLKEPSKELAIDSAQRIFKKGGEKVSYVQAIELTENNRIIKLWEGSLVNG